MVHIIPPKQLNAPTPAEDTREVNAWTGPEARIDIRPYTVLVKAMDDDERETMDILLKEPTVRIRCDLNDQQDYSVAHSKGVARVSETVGINGIRWHLVPGENDVPRSVYELLQQRDADVAQFGIPAKVTYLGHVNQ